MTHPARVSRPDLTGSAALPVSWPTADMRRRSAGFSCARLHIVVQGRRAVGDTTRSCGPGLAPANSLAGDHSARRDAARGDFRVDAARPGWARATRVRQRIARPLAILAVPFGHGLT
ncbi:MAG: hypothetical protein EA339_04390 [Rhodobacteraceae bacterium]|nr:MAG: hypothetical protein EA339_04390 [Paracoccaceae bacterium]